MSIDTVGSNAGPTVRTQASDCGNVSAHNPSKMTLAALAQNKVAAVGKIPAYSWVFGLVYYHAALGANTALEFGYESEDGVDSVPGAFKTVADASASSNGYAAFEPIWLEKDVYVTVKNTGSGDASGVVSAIPKYEYRGV